MSVKKPPKTFTTYERQGHNDAGYGSFGHVYFYRSINNTKEIFAVKVIEEANVRQQELDILQACNHKNIVRYIDSVWQSGLCLVVTELLHSSLYDAMRGAKNSLFVLTTTSTGVRINQTPFLPKLSEYEMFSIVGDCFEGIKYLHSQNIIHRDIYPANILLEVTTSRERSVTAKLCDFGLSKVGCDGHQTVLHNIYSAPETTTKASTSGYTLKADVFSFGVVLAEMVYDLSGEKKNLFNSKFESTSRTEWFNTVRCGSKYSKRATKYVGIVTLVLGMTEADPRKRFTLDQAHAAWLEYHRTTLSGEGSEEDEGDSSYEMDVVEPEPEGEGTDNAEAFAAMKKVLPHLTEEALAAFIAQQKLTA